MKKIKGTGIYTAKPSGLEELKALIKKYNKTIVARALNMSKATVNAIIRNELRITKKRVEATAKILNGEQKKNCPECSYFNPDWLVCKHPKKEQCIVRNPHNRVIDLLFFKANKE